MLTAKSLYEESWRNRVELSNKLMELEYEPKVQEYIRTLNAYNKAKEEEKKWYKEMEFMEYDSCNHILIPTREEGYVSHNISRSFQYCGCIKCGLDEGKHSFIEGKKDVTCESDEIQYEYLSKHNFRIKGQEIDINCGLALAREIYNNIKEENPDITDEEIIKLFNEKFVELKDKLRNSNTDKPKIKQK